MNKKPKWKDFETEPPKMPPGEAFISFAAITERYGDRQLTFATWHKQDNLILDIFGPLKVIKWIPLEDIGLDRRDFY